MTIAVTRDVIDCLREEASQAAPQECCGMLLGDGETIIRIEPAANVAENPLSRFEIDPAALIDAYRAERGGGLKVIGFYHSHPNGVLEPSVRDRAKAAGDGKVWAIVAQGKIGFWRDCADGFIALSYHCAAA